MSRLYALVATAEGMGQAILSAIPQVTYHKGGPNDPEPGRGRRLVYSRGGEDYTVLLLPVAEGVDLPFVSAAPSGDWDVWLLVADSRDNPIGHWRWVAAAQRRLRQVDRTLMLGPFSLADAVERFPQAEALLKADGEWAFPSLAGDSLSAVAAVDYRPTQQEIDEDTDPDPAVLFS